MDSIALVKYKGNFAEALREAATLIEGYGELKSPLMIKPNICTDADVTGVANTNVELVEALINLVLKEDDNLTVRIIESDSESKYADEAFEKFGYNQLAEKFKSKGFDVFLINLSKSPVVEVEFEGLYFKNPKLPKVLTEINYLVSVAVAKTHPLTLITGALKNLFGLLPRKDKSFYHQNINEIIVDLNRIIRPDLCIIDAIVGLEGVVKGRPRRVNTLIVGRNPVSVDATMARVMGFKPEKIHHVVTSKKYNLGTIHPKILGESLESTTVKFRTPSTLNSNALVK